MARIPFSGFGTSNEPYVYTELVDRTKYPKVEVSNFDEVRGITEILSISYMSSNGDSHSFVGDINSQFDGNNSTYFEIAGFQTGETVNFVYDLGSEKTIKAMSQYLSIVTTNSSSPTDFQITVNTQYSTDGENWITLNSGTGSSPFSSTTEDFFTYSEGNFTARYIRYNMVCNTTTGTHSGSVRLYENYAFLEDK